MFQWRRFQFFDKELVVEPDVKGVPAKEKESKSKHGPRDDGDDDSGNAMSIFKEFSPTCSTSGRGHLIFGDAKGVIRIFNREFNKQEFSAHSAEVIEVHQLKRSHILVSLGNELVGGPSIKIWKLDSEDGEGNPVCARSLKVFSAKFPEVPIASFAVLEDLSQAAVGLGNGAVMLFEGNMIRERNIKQSLIQREGPCVTGVHFREENGGVVLFVVTLSEVCSYMTRSSRPGAQHKLTKLLLDSEGGAELKCSLVNEERRLVAGRAEAVYFYEAEEKSICFGFEGTKKVLRWFSNYLILVCENGRDAQRRDTLTIYDLKNKLVAFEGKMESVVDVVCEWGAVFVLTASKKLYQLSEKDLPTKMDMLFKKNLYSVAISLASSQEDCDRSFVIDIFQMYGDHLYSKGDYDGAITQYIETIRYVEPSYVIRKFLDAQRIHNLTRYLQALHEKGRANSDHTTLLLNCYTKLKDVEKLDEFIKGDSGSKFDVETAIRVCRQASYFQHALYLAQKHGQHHLYLKIQLEDECNESAALSYIRSLPFADAERFIKQHGKKLLSALPQQTTDLIILLCTAYKPVVTDPKCAAQVAPPSSLASSSSASPLPNPLAQHDKAHPDDFIHFFVDQPQHLERFLETVAQERKCSTVIYNTLLELYLKQTVDDGLASQESKGEVKSSSTPSSSSERDVTALHAKIMALLKNQESKYDVAHALVLTKTYNFEKGVLFLYSKLKLYHEILQHHMERGQHSRIITACRKYGDEDSSLWVSALSYFAGKKEVCEDEIVQVLDNIERDSLLPPLMVIQILSQSTTKPLAVLKDYIVRTLQQENNIINADQHEIESYQKDTLSMREEIHQLRTQARTFQGIKCHACSSGLSLPAVHFLCMHSFHHHCIVDNDRECPKCAPEFRKVKNLKESLKSSANQTERFFKQLEDSQDGFAAVAEYFGRGILDTNSANE